MQNDKTYQLNKEASVAGSIRQGLSRYYKVLKGPSSERIRAAVSHSSDLKAAAGFADADISINNSILNDYKNHLSQQPVGSLGSKMDMAYIANHEAAINRATKKLNTSTRHAERIDDALKGMLTNTYNARLATGVGIAGTAGAGYAVNQYRQGEKTAMDNTEAASTNRLARTGTLAASAGALGAGAIGVGVGANAYADKVHALYNLTDDLKQWGFLDKGITFEAVPSVAANNRRALVRGSALALGAGVLGYSAYKTMKNSEKTASYHAAYEKYASEAVALYTAEKTAGMMSDFVPSYYKDKKFKQQFVPTMSKADAQAELDYLNSPEGKDAIKRTYKSEQKLQSILGGVTGGIVGAGIGAGSGIGAAGTLGAGVIGAGAGAGLGYLGGKLDEATNINWGPRKALLEYKAR